MYTYCCECEAIERSSLLSDKNDNDVISTTFVFKYELDTNELKDAISDKSN